MQAAVIPGPSMRILPASAEKNKRSTGLPSYHQSFRSRRPLSPYFLHGRLLRCLILSRLFARCLSPLRPRLRNARAAPRSPLPRQMVLLGHRPMRAASFRASGARHRRHRAVVSFLRHQTAFLPAKTPAVSISQADSDPRPPAHMRARAPTRDTLLTLIPVETLGQER